MKKNTQRPQRVAEVIHRELAILIPKTCHDPKIQHITITAVKLSVDLSYATVYVTSMKDDEIEDSVQALNNAVRFLRQGLAKNLNLRAVPRLRFVYDASIQHASNIYNLIDSVTQNEQKPPE